MARFQRKAKYIFGTIVSVRGDGTYDIRYDNGKDEMRVDQSLIIKPETEREIGRRNDDLKAQAVAMEMQARQEQQAEEELEDKGRVVGADCEAQACGACKLVVEEFGEHLYLTCSHAHVCVILLLLHACLPVYGV